MKNEEATKDSLDEYVSEGIVGIRWSKCIMDSLEKGCER